MKSIVKLGDRFETRQRENGESFVTIRADAPAWMLAAVREAHADMLPCDWVYAQCCDACVAIDEDSLFDFEDSLHAWADGAVEVYTQELFAWASRMCLSSLWANAEEEASELCGERATMVERLMAIQYSAIRSIASVMLFAAQAAVASAAENEVFEGSTFGPTEGEAS